MSDRRPRPPHARSVISACWDNPWVTVVVAGVLAGLLHALFIGVDMAPDEGGYLRVAQQWNVDGPKLYGHMWVDRPPGLLVLFHAAGVMGRYGVSLFAAGSAIVLVLSAGWAGWAAYGAAAARWSAIVAAALVSSELLGAHELDGELLAAPFVMLSVAALLHARREWVGSRRRVVLAVLSGGAAAYALLIKQNFIDAIVFAAVLIVAGLARGREGRGRLACVMLAFGLGVAGVGGAVTGWAVEHHRLADLWYAMYGFRMDALGVLDSGPLSAPGLRLFELVGLALLSGVAYLAVAMVAWLLRDLRRGDPLSVAIAVTLAIETIGVALGASYWPHYLIQVIPMIALGCGLVVARGRAGTARRMLRLCLVAASTTLIATPALAVVEHVNGSDAARVGEWVHASSRRGDTIVVTYSHPNVLQASGLTTPYPYAWSLPARTLDPRLSRLTRTVSGPRAPTWIVEWDEFDNWELDSSGSFAAAVMGRYRTVAHVCGHPVWLKRGVDRRVASPPEGCDPGFGE